MIEPAWTEAEAAFIQRLWQRQRKCSAPKLALLPLKPGDAQHIADDLHRRGWLIRSTYYTHNPCYALSPKAHHHLRGLQE